MEKETEKRADFKGMSSGALPKKWPILKENIPNASRGAFYQGGHRACGNLEHKTSS